MKSYRRIMLGHKSVYAPACFAGGFIGIDFGFFVMTADHSNSNIGAGLACGFTWTLCKGTQSSDYRCLSRPIPHITGQNYR
ncbi:MAG: hypothetical protein IT466_05950 [Moraxellaceae bacterium]|nr:hypothetical protein [Moraxellaceae bacterium]MCC6200299.1 hypothetical protein [Moraxellaceae bacterium]